MSLFDEQTMLTHLESLFLPRHCPCTARHCLPAAALARSCLVLIGFAFGKHLLVQSFNLNSHKGESSLDIPPG